MKYKTILIIFFILGCYGYISGISKSNNQINSEKENSDFLKEPVKVMTRIFKYYHNWQLNDGIRIVNNSLQKIDKLYKKDPNIRLSDPKLKLNMVFQIKSTLHTMSGLLYYRQFLEKDKTGENIYTIILATHIKTVNVPCGWAILSAALPQHQLQ